MARQVRTALILLAALGGLICADPTHAEIVSGSASAIDGDSMTVGSREVRLYGIDAPEFRQTCNRDGAEWACGKDARDQLAALLVGTVVNCQGIGVDIHGRMLAICTAGGIEINRALVEYGWALALRSETDTYVPAETRAKSDRIGIWTSTFVSPAEFRGASLPADQVPQRSSQRPVARPAPRRQAVDEQVGCVIKGNRSRRGEWIYYLPGMPYYQETNAEEIFCSEADARAAGYRRARVPRYR
jgi:endonuclease YncB( thermonuclease family)